MNGVAKDYGIPLSPENINGVTYLRDKGIPAFPSTQTMGKMADTYYNESIISPSVLGLPLLTQDNNESGYSGGHYFDPTVA